MRRILVLACLMAVSPLSSASSQSSISVPWTGATKLRVYLAEFEQRGRTPSGVDVVALTKSLLRLQLKSIRGVEVRDSVTSALACPGVPALLTQQSINGRAPQETPSLSDVSTAVVAMRATTDSQHIALEASVQRCSGGSLVMLQHFDQEMGYRSTVNDLVSLVGSIARRLEAEIPKRTVALTRWDAAINDSNSPRLSLTLGAEDFVASRVALLSDVRVLPQDADSDADYRIEGAINFNRFGDGIEGRVYVVPRGSQRPKDAIVVVGSDQRLSDFYAALGEGVAQNLNGQLSRENFRAQVGAAYASDDSLRRQARHALCLEVVTGCVPAADQAAALIGGLLVRQPDPELVALLGQAELARGNTGAASVSFRHAIAAADSVRYDASHRTAARERGLRGLIVIARGGGDNATAMPLYDSLVALVPADSLAARDRALNLRLARRPIASLRELARLSEARPDWTQLLADFDSTLADVSPQTLGENPRSVTEICLGRDALRATCSRVLEQKLAQISRTDADSARTRRLAATLIAVSSDIPQRQIAAYLVIARSFLRPARFVTGPRGTSHAPTDTLSLNGAESAIHSADSLTRLNGSPENVRAVAWASQRLAFARQRYADAFGSAMRLQAQASTDVGEERLLTAEAALMYGYELARSGKGAEAQTTFLAGRTVIQPLVQARQPASYFVFRELGHAAGQDTEIRSTLETISRAYPDDEEAARVLSYSCIEYSKDYQCALDAQRRVYASGRLRSFSDSLDAVETAVLAGDYETAHGWLDPMLVRPSSACFKGVAFLYAYWLAAVKGDARAQDEAVRQRGEARSSEGGSTPCWLFAGARARLQKLDPNQMPAESMTRLIAMMNESEIRQ